MNNILLCVISIITYIILRVIEVNIIFRKNTSPNVPPVRRESRIIAREAFIVGLAVLISNYIMAILGFISSGDGIGVLTANIISYLKGNDKKKVGGESLPILTGKFPEKT